MKKKQRERQGYFKSRYKKYTPEQGFIYIVKWEKYMVNPSKTSLQSVSHDVTAFMLVYQNKEMAAILVYQATPQGIEHSFHANTFFCFTEPRRPLVT